jgi:hypothetical protein
MEANDEDEPGDLERYIRSREVDFVDFHHRSLQYGVTLAYNANDARRYILNNESLQNLIGDEHNAAYRGSFVAMAYRAHTSSEAYTHIDTNALGPVIEYLKFRLIYKGAVFVEQPQAKITDEQLERMKAAMEGLSITRRSDAGGSMSE